MNMRCRQNGFTLIEVLVAMSIIAISLLAAIKVASEVTLSAIHMQEKTLAQWIATNKVSELRLQKKWPSIGRVNGDLEYADRSWHWKTEVTKTQDASVRKVEVSVFPEVEKDADAATVLITAFLGKPL